MYVFLDLECRALLFHADAQVYVQVLSLLSGSLVVLAALIEFGIVCVLYVCSLILVIEALVHAVLDEVGIELIQEPVLTGKVNHRTCLHLAVDHEE